MWAVCCSEARTEFLACKDEESANTWPTGASAGARNKAVAAAVMKIFFLLT